MRQSDRHSEGEHWKQARQARRSFVWIAASGAIAVLIFAPEDVRLWGGFGLMLLAAFLWDSQAALRLISEILDRLPFGRSKPDDAGPDR